MPRSDYTGIAQRIAARVGDQVDRIVRALLRPAAASTLATAVIDLSRSKAYDCRERVAATAVDPGCQSFWHRSYPDTVSVSPGKRLCFKMHLLGTNRNEVCNRLAKLEFAALLLGWQRLTWWWELIQTLRFVIVGMAAKKT
jgi:hypothetical protein